LRKLFMVAALAVAATLFSVSPAAANMPVELMDETNQGLHCPEVSHADGDASGGCHRGVNSDGLVLLIQHRATGDVIGFACIHRYELRLDENGEGWIDDQQFIPGSANCGSSSVLGGVTPCIDPVETHSQGHPEADGEEPLWHIDVEHDGEGIEEAELEFCIDDVIRIDPPPTLSCEWEGDMSLRIFEQTGHDLTAETYDGDVAPEDPEEAHFAIEGQIGHPSGHACDEARSLGEFEIQGHWDIDNEAGEPDTSAQIEVEHLEV
jgi:hypothetical protein